MTSAPGLTLPFRPPAFESGEVLLLEQDAWAASTGVLTRINAVRYIDRQVYTAASDAAPDTPLVDCGLTDAGLAITLHVYPLRSVVFRLAASIGDLSDPRRDDVEEEETLHYTLTTEASLRHPAQQVLSAQWLSGPYDADGLIIAPPPLAVDGQTLRVVGDVVYGSVQVKLLVPRWTSTLTVDWREAAESLVDGWGEYAAAFPDGGRPVALALTAPPGAAEMAASGAGCGGAFRYRVGPSDRPWPPKAQPADKHVNCDYCSGECDDDQSAQP